MPQKQNVMRRAPIYDCFAAKHRRAKRGGYVILGEENTSTPKTLVCHLGRNESTPIKLKGVEPPIWYDRVFREIEHVYCSFPVLCLEISGCQEVEVIRFGLINRLNVPYILPLIAHEQYRGRTRERKFLMIVKEQTKYNLLLKRAQERGGLPYR